VKHSDTKVAIRGYMATDSDLKSFLKWVKGEKDVVVAIEGSNGQSKPIEKALREAEVIFYSFGGKNPEVECGQKVVKSEGILNLLISMPDVGQWKSLSNEQMLEAMGGGSLKGRCELIPELRKVMSSFQPASEAMALLLSSSAHQIQRLKEEQQDIERMLEKMTAENVAVQALRQMRGIATKTAAKMIAEIIDIRRFVCEDSLACYSGLGMREHSTGQTTNMVPTQLFNHRLKDAVMTAARNVVHYNPDSHIAGYYKNLVKAGMSPLEATKRVPRALVRVIYRKLSALTAGTTDAPTGDKQKEGESGMASGSTRSGQSHTSDISLSSPSNHGAKKVKRVKSVVTPTRRTKDDAMREKSNFEKKYLTSLKQSLGHLVQHVDAFVMI
jgi:hypothetical protein